ncbi:hypothetical protein REPUB_Repub03eG0076700 [Reevesia pubescens]
MLQKLAITLKSDEKDLMVKALIKCVMQTWLPASNASLEMMIFNIPSAFKAKKHRVENLHEGPFDDVYANAMNVEGFTASHCAALEGSKKLLQLLISKVAKVDAISNGTPLQCASAKGKNDSVKVLLDNHANPNIESCHTLGPLLLSILSMSIESVKLLNAGTDPNGTNECGLTPIEVTALAGNCNTVDISLIFNRNYVEKDIYFLVGARIIATLQGVSKVAEAVNVTMGLKGRNVISESSRGYHRVTNDGVTLAKSIKFKA